MTKSKWLRIKETCKEQEQHLNQVWYDAWQKYIQEDNNWEGNLRYELIEGNDENYAIIPYAYQTVGPFQFASLAGSFFPHRGFPNTGAKPDLIRNTVSKLSSILRVSGLRISGFRMGPVDQDDQFIGELLEELKRKKWKIISKGIGHHFGVELLSNKDDFLASVSNKRKSKIRRCWKAMERDGKVELKHYNEISAEKWDKIFKEIEIIEKNSWVATKGEPKFIGSANQSFWNSLVIDEWYRRSLNVWILYFNDKPVSYSMEMDTENTRYGLCTSYDKDVAKYGTGVMMRIEIIGQAIESGKKILNEGLGDSGYKSSWGSKKIATLVDLIVFPPTLKGRLAYYTGVIGEFLSNLKKQKG